MKKLYLVLSYDYELPLGGCASFRKGLFEPSEILLSVAERLDVPVTLFADVCSAIRFKEWDEENFFFPFVNQLQTYIKKGHDVQLHIHAHWLTSDYRDGQIIPSRHFALGEFDDPALPYSVREIVRMTSDFLVETCRKVDPGYRCFAYRAGGYNFQPNAQSILKSLYEAGIRIESSVTKGFYLKATSNLVDYTQAPDEPNWFIDLDAAPNVPGLSRLLEVPICSMPVSMLSALRTRFDLRWNRKTIAARQYDHTGYSFPNPRANRSLTDRYRMLMDPDRLSFDHGHYDVNLLLSIVRYTLRKYARYDEASMSVISHPKSMGSYQFQMMEQFVERVRAEFGTLVEFCSYRDIYQKYNLAVT